MKSLKDFIIQEEMAEKDRENSFRALGQAEGLDDKKIQEIIDSFNALDNDEKKKQFGVDGSSFFNSHLTTDNKESGIGLGDIEKDTLDMIRTNFNSIKTYLPKLSDDSYFIDPSKLKKDFKKTVPEFISFIEENVLKNISVKNPPFKDNAINLEKLVLAIAAGGALETIYQKKPAETLSYLKDEKDLINANTIKKALENYKKFEKQINNINLNSTKEIKTIFAMPEPALKALCVKEVSTPTAEKTDDAPEAEKIDNTSTTEKTDSTAETEKVDNTSTAEKTENTPSEVVSKKAIPFTIEAYSDSLEDITNKAIEKISKSYNYNIKNESHTTSSKIITEIFRAPNEESKAYRDRRDKVIANAILKIKAEKAKQLNKLETLFNPNPHATSMEKAKIKAEIGKTLNNMSIKVSSIEKGLNSHLNQNLVGGMVSAAKEDLSSAGKSVSKFFKGTPEQQEKQKKADAEHAEWKSTTNSRKKEDYIQSLNYRIEDKEKEIKTLKDSNEDSTKAERELASLKTTLSREQESTVKKEPTVADKIKNKITEPTVKSDAASKSNIKSTQEKVAANTDTNTETTPVTSQLVNKISGGDVTTNQTNAEVGIELQRRLLAKKYGATPVDGKPLPAPGISQENIDRTVRTPEQIEAGKKKREEELKKQQEEARAASGLKVNGVSAPGVAVSVDTDKKDIKKDFEEIKDEFTTRLDDFINKEKEHTRKKIIDAIKNKIM